MSDQSSPITMPGHNNLVDAVSFSPDGSCVASGSTDCTIQLWSVTDGKFSSAVTFLCFSLETTGFSSFAIEFFVV